MELYNKLYTVIFFFIIFLAIILSNSIVQIKEVRAEISSEYWDKNFQKSNIRIKSVTGQFYAYIVLLFNDNPYYLNLIQEDSIDPNIEQNESFYIKEYSNYLKSLKNHDEKKMAELLMDVYLHPNKFSEKILESIQDKLAKLNIILKFSKKKSNILKELG